MNLVDKRRVSAAFSRSAAAYDGRACVQRHVQDRVVALLKLTRLDTLIRIFPDDEAALAYLAG